MKVKVDDCCYEVVYNYKNAFSESEFLNRYTDYFKNYDYIVGDIAYSKLRLKGFCDTKNKIRNKINDYKTVDDYIKNSCAVDCKYFILKKVKDV